jgi:hypothetical protein
MRFPTHPLIAITFLIVAAVALAPAALLDAPIEHASEGRLRLSDASGLWWRGAGTLAIADGTVRIPIGWRLDSASLLRGERVVQVVDGRTGAAIGTLMESRGERRVQNLHLDVPATTLAGLDRRLATFAFGGQATLDVPSFASRDNVPADGLRATWSRARIVVADNVIDLGTVTVVATPRGQAIFGTIQNVGGDVLVTGTLEEHASGIDVALTLRPTTAAPDGVGTLLQTLGPADGTGGVSVTWHAGR